MAPKHTPRSSTSKTTSKAQKKRLQQEQNQTQSEASQEKAQKKKGEEKVPQKSQQVSEMPSNPEVIKRRYTGVVSGTAFNTRNLPDPVKKKITSSDANGLWKKLKDMEKRCSDHMAKWEARPRLLRGPNETLQQEWEDAIRKQYDEWHSESVKKNEDITELGCELIRKSHECLKYGVVAATVCRKAILTAEEMIANVTRDNVILKSCKNQIGGDFLDSFRRANHTDMAYVDSIISRQEELWGSMATLKSGKRDEDKQKKWSKRLLKSYAAMKNGKEWCPIARVWYSCEEKDIIAAHLVPHNIGKVNCNYLFGSLGEGDDGNHFYSTSNGLPMHEKFERALNKARIIIVPALKGDRDPETGKEVDFENDKEPLKIQVLDKSLIDEEKGADKYIGTVRTSKLQGRFLEFNTDFRPSEQYLWFVAIIAIARRRRCKVPGWTEDLEALGKECWATSGQWLRRSTMHCIMRYIGLEEDPGSLLHGGFPLRGGFEETSFDQEIAERVAVNFSLPRDEDEDSTRCYSNFSEMHSMEGTCARDENEGEAWDDAQTDKSQGDSSESWSLERLDYDGDDSPFSSHIPSPTISN